MLLSSVTFFVYTLLKNLNENSLHSSVTRAATLHQRLRPGNITQDASILHSGKINA